MLKTAYRSLRHTVTNLDSQYILKGGFWLSVGQGTAIVAAFATAYVFANFVDAADYGIYKYVLSLSVIFGALTVTGMIQSVIQATARGYYSFIKIGFTTSVLYGTITTIVSLLAASYYFINDNYTIAIGCVLIALFIPLTSASQLLYGQLQGLQRFSLSAKLQATKTVLSATAVVGTIFITDNVMYYLVAYFVTNALVSLIIYFFTQWTLQVPQDTEGTEGSKSKYLSYAKHSSIRDILTIITHEVDKILAFQLLGATQLAIYAFAIAIPEQFKGVFKNLALLILVKFTGYSLQGIKKNLLKKVFLLGLILVILTAAYIMAAPFIYAILFPDYIESVFLSQIFALSFPMMIAIFPISALQAQMREKDLHALNIGTSLLLIASLYAGVTFFGLMGLVLSRVFVRYINCIATFFLLYRK